MSDDDRRVLAGDTSTTILIMRRAHLGDQTLPMWNDFWTAVYQAIDH